jgi:hypothetical protein
MFKRITVLTPFMSLVCMLVGCTNSQPSIIVRATVNNNTTSLCVKGSGFTPNGPLRLSVTMPPYSLNGQPGPNPIANAPFGNATAQSNGGFQLTTSIGPLSAVCSVLQNQNAPSEPVLLVLDETTLTGGAAGLPPGFMCGSQQSLTPPGPPTPIPPPPPFGDPSACQ